jgi:hypothetical protein
VPCRHCEWTETASRQEPQIARDCKSLETVPHWGSDREPSDSFESVRFDSRSPNFLREVCYSYYSVCVDNVTFDRDYVGDSKKTVRDFQKGNNLRVTEATVERPPAGTIKQRSNKVATPHSK